MSEELIIEYCSPTLAGIKAGSMFSVRVTEDTDINNEVRELNKILRGKGLRVIPLKKTSRWGFWIDEACLTNLLLNSNL